MQNELVFVSRSGSGEVPGILPVTAPKPQPWPENNLAAASITARQNEELSYGRVQEAIGKHYGKASGGVRVFLRNMRAEYLLNVEAAISSILAGHGELVIPTASAPAKAARRKT